VSTELGIILACLRGDSPKTRWAKRCGVTDEHVRRLERGSSLPSKKLLDTMLLLSRSDDDTKKRTYVILGAAKREANPAIQEYLALEDAFERPTDGFQADKFRHVMQTVCIDAGYMAPHEGGIVTEQVIQSMRNR